MKTIHPILNTYWDVSIMHIGIGYNKRFCELQNGNQIEIRTYHFLLLKVVDVIEHRKRIYQ